jgi:hypothetical protein
VTGRIARAAGSALVALLGAATLSSCTSVHNTLGTRDSPCFRVLPTAIHAVGGKGRYKGVRFAPANTLVLDIHRQRQDQPGMPVPPDLIAAEKVPTCLVEYQGNFTMGDLVAAWSPSGSTMGTYAIVVIRQRDSSLVASVLLRHEPLRFTDFPG